MTAQVDTNAGVRTSPGERVRTPGLPRAGDVLRLGRKASPQFVKPILFRVIRVRPTDTADSDGWMWLDGYQLDDAGDAVEQRALFVNLAGLAWVR